VDQSSGVSARMPIAAVEILASNLERRALKHGEKRVAPRLCDLPATLPAITGKVEMVYEGEQQGAEVVAKRLIGTAVKKLFDARFPAPDSGRPTQRRRDEQDEMTDEIPPVRRARANPPPEKIHPLYEPIVEWFAAGNKITLSDDTAFSEHLTALESVPGLRKAVEAHFAPATPEERAVGMELVLEGLTQHLKIAREDLDSKVSYTEMLKFNLVRSRTS
jgi:magnesium chelatase subunit I